MQSTREQQVEAGASFHVGIIMDGNGRWAARRDEPRVAGHRAGIETVRRIVEAAPALGITKLTLFAFSADNWRRPPDEIGALMTLLQTYLETEIGRLIENGIRLDIIGRRDRLPAPLVRAIAAAEARTASGSRLRLRLRLRVALDYSARYAITRAACLLGPAAASGDIFGRMITQCGPGNDSAPEVDLLIRTGGEQRLSDFLLWESAYAELWFTKRMWPEFSVDDLRAAIDDFCCRERRFGGLVETATPAATSLSPSLTAPIGGAR
jgi:undecaprenyl diphosphate synthase